MDKFLELKIDVGGGAGSAPFPNVENPIEISAFRYEAKRMGGAPTITASVNYPSCLDDEWTDRVYAEFNGEKYYLKQTPTSSFSNEDNRYKHNIELISERAILDDVYFFDVVTGDPQGDDKPVSNSSKVIFFGNIHEFVARLNASLQYSNIDYVVIVDDDVKTEDKLVSFEDQFFSNVLQEIYKTYEVPYYFDGKIIRIGYSKDGVDIPDLEYGVDNALLSITKNNANYKIVNRATGVGSSENIPFYYPNNSPKGDVVVETSREDLEVIIADYERFCDNVGANKEIKFYGYSNYVGDVSYETPNNTKKEYTYGKLIITEAREIRFITNVESDGKSILHYTPTFTISQLIEEGKGEEGWDEGSELHDTSKIVAKKTIELVYGKNSVVWYKDFYSNDEPCDIEIPYEGNFKVVTTFYWNHPFSSNFKHSKFFIYLRHDASFEVSYGWYYDDKRVNLNSLGLAVSESTDLEIGDTIIQRLKKHVNTSKNLMPSIYRETDGANRFYNAVNEIYPFEFVDGYELKDGEYVGEDGMVHHPDHYEYKNPFVEGRPKEHIIKIDDIKPTIEGVINSKGLRIDMFSEFAYDDDDNDETLPEEDSSDRKFLHAYFFGKLRKLDFNLFDHAIEQQPMTVSFTSGDCGACKFEIGVTDEFPKKNPVQVDANGNLVRDENGRVVCGQFAPIKESQCQPKQQDTINNEVWIALKKEDETYGILMPKAPKFNEAGKQIEAGHRPKACDKGENNGDTFAVLGINLPKPYILNAEKKLEGEIIRYLQENNEEKFTFNINFSKIYFAENEDILKSLNENSKIRLIYDNKPYDLYVSSFSYSMSDGDILPDINVTLDDTLKVSSNAIRNAINEVKSSLGSNINEVANAVAMQSRSYLSKIEDDNAQGVVNFSKGITFGGGGRVDVLDENSAKLTIDYLEIKKKATFTSLEIQEKSHVGGQILVTPAAINCGEVEEFEDFYRCYFQTKGVEGDEIFNQFAIDDQAICQTYNTWGSRYYWRKVVGVGEDYIDLSKVEGEYDEDSDIPMAGDKIIQLGNQTDATRQNAIVIAAYGDGSPYIIQYKGINAFEITDDKIVTKLSSTENIFTGKVHMELGSDGLDTLPEWIEVKETAQEALEKAGSIGEEAFAELEEYIEGVRQELQEQIDGAIDSYFEDYEPSTSNFPAKDWATDDEKRAHLNDTFTNLSDGRSWRWSKSANTYAWVEIADTATSEALKIAGQAKTSADGKIRMFVNQPTTPYSIGDLWSRGDDAPLMCCIKAKDTGNFEEDDWGLADNSQSYTDDAISNIKLGGTNLLRNSGFTGDYLSEQLADEKVLEGAAELYSSPLDHWTTTSSTVLDSTETISGKVANISSGGISQTLYYKTSIGEDYVLSFKAKGRGNLTYTVGDASGSVALTTTMTFYEVVVTPTISSDTFIIKDANCTIGDLKLEKGNKATSWSASPLDNASDRAYYQSLKYIQNAFEGATEVNGGLVLTEQIKVGDYNKETKKWVKESGGMSGVYESGHDVAFWAGGNFEQAIATVMKYVENPNYQPTEEQLSSMVQFVVTHGGRAILNEAIVRGDIYANNGRFRGVVEALSGVFNNVDVQSGKIADFEISGSHIGIDKDIENGSNVANGMFLYDQYVGFSNKEAGYERTAIMGHNVLPSFGGVTALAKFDNTTTDSFETLMGTGYGIISNVSGYKDSYAFASEKGVFAGFRPHVTILGSDNSPLQLGKYHHTVLALYGGTIVLDGTPENGQEYEIICPNTSVEEGRVQVITYDGVGNIYLMYDGDKRSGFSVHDLGGTRQVVKLVYFDKDKTWFCWHHIY